MADYTADSITILEGLQAVRERPGMYIGDTQTAGLHQLVFEVVDNSVDEKMAGYCNEISVVLAMDGAVFVEDNGRGIPIDVHEQESKKQGRDVSAVEVVMTTLHAGGKFDKNSYKVSGGLHGVGVSCVNALSERMVVEVYRDGSVHRIEFSKGKVVSGGLKVTESTTKQGTKVYFVPDSGIFETTTFNHGILMNRLRELTFLNKGLRIRFRDERAGEYLENEFKYDGGLSSFVSFLNESKSPIFDDPIAISGGRDLDGDLLEFECAMQWNHTYSESMYSYVNNIFTRSGGTHVSGFYSALTRSVNQYAKNNNLLKGIKVSITGEDIREGLACVLSVRLSNPQFEGQTKHRLGNASVSSAVQQIVGEALGIYLEENPPIARKIVDKAIAAAQGREAAKRARELVLDKKSQLDCSRLSGKLFDCREKDPAKREIFIVEGQSAGGSAQMARNSKNQAVLSMKGKMLNVDKARLQRVLQDQDVSAMVSAFGCGIGQDYFDLSKLRYHRIIIMTDADVDGSHIRTLLLTFFYRYLPELIENGHVYIAQPPLYRVSRKKSVKYIHSEDEMDRYYMELGSSDVVVRNLISKSEIVGKDLERFLDSVLRLESEVISVERKGVPFQEFLLARDESRGFPRFQVVIGGDRIFAYSHDDLSRLKAQYDTDIDQDVDITDGKKFVYIEFADSRSLKSLAENLLPFQYNLEHYCSPDVPLISVTRSANVDDGTFNSDAECLYTLRDFVKCIRNNGRRWIEVQRYKGLGEMNPDQLWVTTMDPEERKLIRMKITDVFAVESTVTMFMGSHVEERKMYIQNNALSISNLDA